MDSLDASDSVFASDDGDLGVALACTVRNLRSSTAAVRRGAGGFEAMQRHLDDSVMVGYLDRNSQGTAASERAGADLPGSWNALTRVLVEVAKVEVDAAAAKAAQQAKPAAARRAVTTKHAVNALSLLTSAANLAIHGTQRRRRATRERGASGAGDASRAGGGNRRDLGLLGPSVARSIVKHGMAGLVNSQVRAAGLIPDYCSLFRDLIITPPLLVPGILSPRSCQSLVSSLLGLVQISQKEGLSLPAAEMLAQLLDNYAEIEFWDAEPSVVEDDDEGDDPLPEPVVPLKVLFAQVRTLLEREVDRAGDDAHFLLTAVTTVVRSRGSSAYETLRACGDSFLAYVSGVLRSDCATSRYRSSLEYLLIHIACSSANCARRDGSLSEDDPLVRFLPRLHKLLVGAGGNVVDQHAFSTLAVVEQVATVSSSWLATGLPSAAPFSRRFSVLGNTEAQVAALWYTCAALVIQHIDRIVVTGRALPAVGLDGNRGGTEDDMADSPIGGDDDEWQVFRSPGGAAALLWGSFDASAVSEPLPSSPASGVSRSPRRSPMARAAAGGERADDISPGKLQLATILLRVERSSVDRIATSALAASVMGALSTLRAGRRRPHEAHVWALSFLGELAAAVGARARRPKARPRSRQACRDGRFDGVDAAIASELEVHTASVADAPRLQAAWDAVWEQLMPGGLQEYAPLSGGRPDGALVAAIRVVDALLSHNLVTETLVADRLDMLWHSTLFQGDRRGDRPAGELRAHAGQDDPVVLSLVSLVLQHRGVANAQDTIAAAASVVDFLGDFVAPLDDGDGVDVEPRLRVAVTAALPRRRGRLLAWMAGVVANHISECGSLERSRRLSVALDRFAVAVAAVVAGGPAPASVMHRQAPEGASNSWSHRWILDSVSGVQGDGKDGHGPVGVMGCIMADLADLLAPQHVAGDGFHDVCTGPPPERDRRLNAADAAVTSNGVHCSLVPATQADELRRALASCLTILADVTFRTCAPASAGAGGAGGAGGGGLQMDASRRGTDPDSCAASAITLLSVAQLCYSIAARLFIYHGSDLARVCRAASRLLRAATAPCFSLLAHKSLAAEALSRLRDCAAAMRHVTLALQGSKDAALLLEDGHVLSATLMRSLRAHCSISLTKSLPGDRAIADAIEEYTMETGGVDGAAVEAAQPGGVRRRRRRGAGASPALARARLEYEEDADDAKSDASDSGDRASRPRGILRASRRPMPNWMSVSAAPSLLTDACVCFTVDALIMLDAVVRPADGEHPLPSLPAAIARLASAWEEGRVEQTALQLAHKSGRVGGMARVALLRLVTWAPLSAAYQRNNAELRRAVQVAWTRTLKELRTIQHELVTVLRWEWAQLPVLQAECWLMAVGHELDSEVWSTAIQFQGQAKKKTVGDLIGGVLHAARQQQSSSRTRLALLEAGAAFVATGVPPDALASHFCADLLRACHDLDEQVRQCAARGLSSIAEAFDCVVDGWKIRETLLLLDDTARDSEVYEALALTQAHALSELCKPDTSDADSVIVDLVLRAGGGGDNAEGSPSSRYAAHLVHGVAKHRGFKSTKHMMGYYAPSLYDGWFSSAALEGGRGAAVASARSICEFPYRLCGFDSARRFCDDQLGPLLAAAVVAGSPHGLAVADRFVDELIDVAERRGTEAVDAARWRLLDAVALPVIVGMLMPMQRRSDDDGVERARATHEYLFSRARRAGVTMDKPRLFRVAWEGARRGFVHTLFLLAASASRDRPSRVSLKTLHKTLHNVSKSNSSRPLQVAEFVGDADPAALASSLRCVLLDCPPGTHRLRAAQTLGLLTTVLWKSGATDLPVFEELLTATSACMMDERSVQVRAYGAEALLRLWAHASEPNLSYLGHVSAVRDIVATAIWSMMTSVALLQEPHDFSSLSDVALKRDRRRWIRRARAEAAVEEVEGQDRRALVATVQNRSVSAFLDDVAADEEADDNDSTSLMRLLAAASAVVELALSTELCASVDIELMVQSAKVELSLSDAIERANDEDTADAQKFVEQAVAALAEDLHCDAADTTAEMTPLTAFETLRAVNVRLAFVALPADALKFRMEAEVGAAARNPAVPPLCSALALVARLLSRATGVREALQLIQRGRMGSADERRVALSHTAYLLCCLTSQRFPASVQNRAAECLAFYGSTLQAVLPSDVAAEYSAAAASTVWSLVGTRRDDARGAADASLLYPVGSHAGGGPMWDNPLTNVRWKAVAVLRSATSCSATTTARLSWAALRAIGEEGEAQSLWAVLPSEAAVACAPFIQGSASTAEPGTLFLGIEDDDPVSSLLPSMWATEGRAFDDWVTCLTSTMIHELVPCPLLKQTAAVAAHDAAVAEALFPLAIACLLTSSGSSSSEWRLNEYSLSDVAGFAVSGKRVESTVVRRRLSDRVSEVMRTASKEWQSAGADSPSGGGSADSKRACALLVRVLSQLRELRAALFRAVAANAGARETDRSSVCQLSLDVPYVDVAKVALWCGMPTDANMFLEVAAATRFSDVDNADGRALWLAVASVVPDVDAVASVPRDGRLSVARAVAGQQEDWLRAAQMGDIALAAGADDVTRWDVAACLKGLGLEHTLEAYLSAHGGGTGAVGTRRLGLDERRRLREQQFEAAWQCRRWGFEPDTTAALPAGRSPVQFNETVFRLLESLAQGSTASIAAQTSTARVDLVQSMPSVATGDGRVAVAYRVAERLAMLDCVTEVAGVLGSLDDPQEALSRLQQGWSRAGDDLALLRTSLMRDSSAHNGFVEGRAVFGRSLARGNVTQAARALEDLRKIVAAETHEEASLSMVKRRSVALRALQVRFYEAALLWSWQDAANCAAAVAAGEAVVDELTSTPGLMAFTEGALVAIRVRCACAAWRAGYSFDIIDSDDDVGRAVEENAGAGAVGSSAEAGEHLRRAVAATAAVGGAEGATLARRANLLFARYSDRVYSSLLSHRESDAWRDCEAARLRHADEFERASAVKRDLQAEKRKAKGAQAKRVEKQLQEVRRFLAHRSLIVARDRDELKAADRSVRDHLHSAITSYAAALSLGSPGMDKRSAFRLVALWFANDSDDALNKTFGEAVAAVPAASFVPLVPQLVARLGAGIPAFAEQLQSLLVRATTHHPYHTIVPLLATINAGRHAEAKQGRGAQGRAAWSLKASAAESVLHAVQASDAEGAAAETRIQALRFLVDAYATVAAVNHNRKDGLRYPLSKIVLAAGGGNFKSYFDSNTAEKAYMPVLTAPDALPSAELGDDEQSELRRAPVVQLKGFRDEYSITPSGLSAPKVLRAIGSNGKVYRQLVKGRDDSRQDAVMQQLFAIVNDLLRGDAHTRERKLRVRTYTVIPLTPLAGLLEFAEGTKGFSEWLTTPVGGSPHGAHGRLRPADLPHTKVWRMMRAAGEKGKPSALRKYREVCERFQPVFRHWFLERFPQPSRWHARRVAFTRSAAVSSMVGYVVGLGDRHPHNLLIDSRTAEGAPAARVPAACSVCQLTRCVVGVGVVVLRVVRWQWCTSTLAWRSRPGGCWRRRSWCRSA